MFARCIAILIVIFAWPFGAPAAHAENAEAFLRAQLLAGKDVDFDANGNCGAFRPESIADLFEAAACRTVSGTALANAIKDKKINEFLSSHGLHIKGMVVKGEVDLHWADIKANLICIDCAFGGKIDLAEATAEHDLCFEGSELLAGLDGSSAQIKGRLSFTKHTRVGGGTANMRFAKISDVLETDAAVFGGESPLDLRNATISHVTLHASTFKAGVQARDADIEGALLIDGGTSVSGPGLDMKGIEVDSFVRIDGNVNISYLNISSAEIKNNAVFDGNIYVGYGGVDITNTAIDGQLSFDDSIIDGKFVAKGMSISKGMDTTNMRFNGNVYLDRAQVGGDLQFENDSILHFEAQRLHVGGSLYLSRDKIEGGGLDMKGASIGADMIITATHIGKDLEFNQAMVGKQLSFDDGASVAGEARFAGMTVGGDFWIGYITDQQLPPVVFNKSDFDLALISSNLFIHNAKFSDNLQLVGTEIKGHFDTTSAELPGLDMTRGVVGGDLRLAAADERHRTTQWQPMATLTLKNAHVGVIQDESDRRGSDPWPTTVDLEGFTFDRFGRLPPVEWIQQEWFDRSAFQPSAYVKLAKYYADEGQKELSDRTLYAEKTKETIEAWHRCAEPKVSSCAHALGLTALRVLIGYGIGNGLFQALIWVVVLTIVGMLVLRWTQTGEPWGGPNRGPLWCIGASINHLIPIVELNEEFKDYFNDPNRERLAPWQLRYFAVHAMMGYVLASFVVAAIAGLTQAH